MYSLRLIVVTALSSLAAGCCCPALSGRYYEVGLPPPQAAISPAPALERQSPVSAEKCAHDNCHRERGRLHGWLARGQHGPMPSQQQYDYVAPLPKFHPAPTRPVFEPQPYYLPPLAPAAKPPGIASESPKTAPS